MNNLIRAFLDSLQNRIIGSLGSIIGNTFSTYRAAQHAEQQSLLEDLARQYEAEGKTDLANNLRNQAACLEVDDPGKEARIVFQNVLTDQSQFAALVDRRDDPGTGDESPAAGKKKRRGRKAASQSDDMDISLD